MKARANLTKQTALSALKHHARSWCDVYTGTQDALIQAGICKPEWFPKELGKDKRGRTKRQYKIQDTGHILINKGDDLWEATIKLEEGPEKERRFAEYRKKMEMDALSAGARERNRPPEPTPGAHAPIEKRAAFDVADRAVLFIPGAEDHLDPVFIVKGYGLHKVTMEEGGTETEDLWGYVVMPKGGAKQFFVPAHQLREHAHKPFHLRLAAANV